MSLGTYNPKRHNRWYFGGISAATAACVTHPLDLLKVLLQTQTEKPPLSLTQLIAKVYRTEGIMGFYCGISASLMRQFTFTMARMGVYEKFKYSIPDNNATLQLCLAFGAGICGALVGMPADLTNVRMQNDMRLPVEQRRNYKHVIDGLTRIIKEEGFTSLYAGTTPNIIRGILLTMSTNVVYDQVKFRLLDFGVKDNIGTHITCSIIAACTGTTATNPIDIIKTRMMNAGPNEPKGIISVFRLTAKQGPLAFFKGYIPSLVRITPQTILVFVIMEQLRIYFGYLPPTTDKDK